MGARMARHAQRFEVSGETVFCYVATRTAVA